MPSVFMSLPDQPSENDSSPFGEHSLIDQAAAWFARLRSSQVSPEEREAFEMWRRECPAHQAAYEEVCELWDDRSLKAAARHAALDTVSIPGHIDDPDIPRPWLTRVALAVTVAGLAIAVTLQAELPLRFAADYRTATGDRRVVSLPDQSTVILNTRSAIAMDFSEDGRRIRLLRGEAFFQVQPDLTRHFVVENRKILSKAVGTAFIVREEPNGIRLTVTEGIVEVAPSQPGWHPVQVTAGQQIDIDQRGTGPRRHIDITTATAWLRDRLVVEDAPLGDVIDELCRYHPGTIVVWNDAIRTIRVSGSYNLADPSGAVTALVQSLPIRMASLTDRLIVLF